MVSGILDETTGLFSGRCCADAVVTWVTWITWMTQNLEDLEDTTNTEVTLGK